MNLQDVRITLRWAVDEARLEDDRSLNNREEIKKKRGSMVFLSAPSGDPFLEIGKGNLKLVQGKSRLQRNRSWYRLGDGGEGRGRRCGASRSRQTTP